MFTKLLKGWRYSAHQETLAAGHIFMPHANGACTIQLVGSASMSQAHLDALGEIIAAAVDKFELPKE